MKKIRYIILAVLCAVGVSACQDDLTIEGNGVDASQAMQVKLQFSVPNSEEITVSRANNDNAELGDLRLYIFNGDSFLKAQNATNITKGAATNEGQLYTVDATLYKGKQTVYAVGNTTTQTNYWTNPVEALDAAALNGKTEFLKTLYNVRQDVIDGGFVTFPGNYRPLAGSGDITVSDNGIPSGEIRMKREVARIKLNINMNYTVESGERRGNTVSFTPQTYSVYNVAGKAYVMEDGNSQDAAVSEGFYAVENRSNFDVSDGQVATIGDGFSIPENIQYAKKPCTTYNDRERWNGTENSGADDDAKTWTNAPDYGTYIVIKGNYLETDASGKVIYSGATSYTFHLGNWNNNNFDNFSVKRNSIYTYTMSVLGIENIKVEVEEETDGEQPGAEGDVIELDEGSEVFNLDAHYEQVYVEYNLSAVANNIKISGISENEIEDAIATNFMLSIHSPMNIKSGAEELIRPYTGINEEADMTGIDTEWVEFYSQTGRNQLSSYTSVRGNESYLLTPWQACKKMGEAVKALIDNPNNAPSITGLRVSQYGNSYYARFTVFVDEYFYTKDLEGNKVSWEKFTRAEPRTLLIASNWKASPDGNSTYAKARTYISQASIITFYNTEAAQTTNALGIESYNEYGVIEGFGTPHSTYYRKANSEGNEINGRANMKMDTYGMEWNEVPFGRIGYLSANTGTDGHTWKELNESDKRNSAYYACLSRNRDLNRNGQIDDDEIRWYLPSRSQYLRMGIGTNAFNTDVRLYTGDKNKMNKNNYPTSYVDKGALYYSNTTNNEDNNQDLWELYWAVEVGAYGSNHKGSPMYGAKAQIRCVRNLPSYKNVESDKNSYGDEALAGPVYEQLKRLQDGNRNYLFDFDNRMDKDIYRSSVFNGPYAEHVETSEQNRLYKAFIVAKDYIKNRRGNVTYSSATGASSGKSNPCYNYSEARDKSDIGKWRTPNLNELTVMSTVANELDLEASTLSSTKFTNQNVRFGFYYNGSIISAWDPGQGSGPIRCVRDATDEEIRSARPVN